MFTDSKYLYEFLSDSETNCEEIWFWIRYVEKAYFKKNDR